MEPQIRFCTSADGTRLSYSLMGEEGAPPVVQVNSWFYYQQLWWTAGQWRRPEALRAMFGGLAHGRWLATFDRRGVGGSQREVIDVSLEAHVADLAAIVDHLGFERFDLSGWYDGAAVTVAYAVEHPERVSRLVLYSPRRAEDWASPEASGTVVELIRRDWPLGRRMLADLVFPDAPPEVRHGLADALRDGTSPEVAAKYVEYMTSLDLATLLPRVQVPALILEPRRVATRGGAGQAIAAMIPDARLTLLEVEAIVDSEEMVRHFQRFLAEGREDHGKVSAIPSGMTAILFADIVESTAMTERMGDTAFRDKARDLDESLRSIIAEASGTPVEGKLLGDGVLAVFTSARQAIEAALKCGAAGESGGLPLHLGVHAGDVIEEDGNVFGGAVNIAARVAAESAPGEVLVSQTVRDLARTSAGVEFEDAGERTLKGVGEPVRVWRVRSA